MKYKLIITIITIITIIILLGLITAIVLQEKNNIDIEEEQIEYEDEIVIENYELSLVMVGDVLYHYDVYLDGRNRSESAYDFTHNLVNIKSIISNYDLAYYNQESILAGTSIGLDSYPRFNSPTQVGDAFIDSGFNLVSLANNHTLDKSQIGIDLSLQYWSDKPVVTAGSYSSQEEKDNIIINSKNNINYVFLSYTTTTNGLIVPSGKDYLVDVYDYELVKSDIEKVKDKTDVIIVAMHWGNEYQFTPSDNQRQIASELSDLGVDIVIGTHPHVVQPIEYVNDTIVFYSLGNFLTGQLGIEKNVGLLGSLTINKEVINDISTVTIGEVSGDLIYTYKEIYNELNYGRNYTVYPFYQLTDNILYNYKDIKNTYEGYLNPLNDARILIGQLGL